MHWTNKSNIPTRLDNLLSPYKDQNLTLLDLGCGAGRFKNHFQKIKGIDKSFQSNDIVQGDFQNENTWKLLNEKFDIIVSNCAIRKDYCPNLKKVVKLCLQYLKPNGVIIFRIQAYEDLSNIIPNDIRKNIFYNKLEIEKVFPNTKLQIDKYVQKFSSEKYIKEFLRKILINYNGRVSNLYVNRYYYLVKNEVQKIRQWN